MPDELKTNRMIRETMPLYKATFEVVPAGAGRPFEHTITLPANDFEEACNAAQPTVGYYTFELLKLERVGDVAVTW